MALAVGGSVWTGCGAGNTIDDDSSDGSGGADGNANSSANGFTDGSGAGSTGSGPQCTDPSCIGGGVQGNCDQSLALDSSDAMDGARAIGLCQQASNGSWGVVSAEWVGSGGQPLSGSGLLGKGILDHFGNSVSPREGAKLLALSSGTARNPSDAGYQSVGGYWKDCVDDPNCDGVFTLPQPDSTPPGYPSTSATCDVQAGEAFDSAGLRVTIKTPTDAKSLSYSLKFYTYEFPDYICSQYNDFFVAIMNPAPTGALSGNISFDSQGNTISVNAGFLDECNPGQLSGYDCPAGYDEIVGTGFDEQDPGSGATSWLETTAPIESPGSEITLHFAIWDSGDGVLDSTILIDNFKFEVDENSVGTTPIPQ
ncbi:MAG TPA: choice-of-anchor L domain-containing protein [Polyangiaceae bacterium]|nr:choice-of-anchor L domain-containing protein [Polyangiaceae bacterium]